MGTGITPSETSIPGQVRVDGETGAPPETVRAFTRHFGENHNVELLPSVRCGYRPLLSFSGEGEA